MAGTVQVGLTDALLTGALLSIEGAKLGHIQLNNTQIKAAPTTLRFEIVPAVGGKVNVPLFGLVVTKFSAGAYTNVSTGDYAGSIGFEVNAGNGYGTNYLFNNAAGVYQTNYSELFAAQNRIVSFLPYHVLSSAAVDEIIARSQLISVYQGNITLSVANTAGNFTGGNAANTLDAYIVYLSISV